MVHVGGKVGYRGITLGSVFSLKMSPPRTSTLFLQTGYSFCRRQNFGFAFGCPLDIGFQIRKRHCMCLEHEAAKDGSLPASWFGTKEGLEVCEQGIVVPLVRTVDTAEGILRSHSSASCSLGARGIDKMVASPRLCSIEVAFSNKIFMSIHHVDREEPSRLTYARDSHIELQAPLFNLFGEKGVPRPPKYPL